jgi:sugar/nucleoside kinase (ribokinase family)
VPEVICLGELLIDLASTAADVSLAEAPGFTKAPGGAPANVAVAVRRLGVSAGFIGAVGNDPFGDFLADVLRREGVDTACLVRLDDVRTPLAFVAVRSDGAGDFSFYHDAGLAPLREEHVDEAYVSAAAALHFGSISRIGPAARAATDKARAVAGRRGLLVSYDPNYRPRLWASPAEARRRIREGFEAVTLAKVSQEEWEFILGTDDFAGGAGELLDAGVALVVRSEGGAGASFASVRACGHVEPFEVEGVEFTGAGDAFTGSLLVDLLKHRGESVSPGELDEAGLRRIVRRANAVGALATTRRGAIPALPRRAEVDAFLTAAGERP